jgi:site-specific recombinase XerD
MTTDPTRVRVSGPLAPHAAGFAEELIRRGYPPKRAGRHVQLLAQLSCWLEQEGLTAEDLTQERVAAFLEARRASYGESPTLSWVLTLLGFLPALAVAPSVATEALTPVEELVEQYRRYLLNERGLTVKSLPGYQAAAWLFLSCCDGPDGLDMSQVTAEHMTALVVHECRRRPAGSAKALVTQLRSFARFVFLEGHVEHQLASAVPAVSAMRGRFLPQGLGADVVRKLLASCDRCTLVGRRDFAILTVLCRLGLRAGEVSGLELDDLDWHHGELVLRGKGSRIDRLPLPVDVGEALVAYLSEARPRVDCRAVFLRVHAPIAALTRSSVSEIVRRACKRAGVPLVRAHRLRHAAASAMLQGGASLAEIGQILRHSHADTTAMYAKVDRAALRQLAQPWPAVSAR